MPGAVDGSGDRGTSLIRVRYPDCSRWWAINLYELRDGKIAHSRSFFAPELEPPTGALRIGSHARRTEPEVV